METNQIEYEKIMKARNYLKWRKIKIQEITMELSLLVIEIKKLKTQSVLTELRIKQINSIQK
ncbi:Hypothetical protein PACV_48 [Pacmanvirus A23]|uniref:Hypothetical protein n=1 Tax=Pacmanvirus A23 TaxID=1932881 RepID=UPI000A095908|nr:Hypothetical protein B9W72_gp048 [Pacmanvirus A23]SIP85765.1 Hypothetical protein PACV_48 [Pacmanvirus A23]